MKKILAVTLLLTSVSLLAGCGHHHKHRHGYAAGVADLTTLTVGVPVTGHIDGAEDADKYTVVLEKDKVYLFHTLNLSADMDTVVLVFDSEGTLLAENDNGSEASLASILQYQTLEDGVYCVVVRHKSPEAVSGMYDLIVEYISDVPVGDDTNDGGGGDDSDDGDSGDGDGSDGGDDGSGDDGSGDDGSGDDDSECEGHTHDHEHTLGQGHSCD